MKKQIQQANWILPFSWITFLAIILVFSSCRQNENQQNYVEAPAGSQYCTIDPAGTTIIPNGRFIKPYGKQYVVAPHPYGLVLSHDGSIAVTANSGVNPFSVSVLRNIGSDSLTVQQIPEGHYSDKGVLESVFMGLAVSPDNQLLYVAGGNSNKVFIFDLKTGEKVDSIHCAVADADRSYRDGYLGDMVLSADGQTIYVVDQINFCVNILDTKTRTLTGRVAVGRYPFGITFSPDEKKLYVANVGMFAYQPLQGLTPDNYKETALEWPASSYLSEEAKEGYTLNDSIKVPGLGNPNAPESFSVWAIDIADSAFISAKIKTGYLVGEEIEGIPAVGGSSPNSLVASDEYIFVSNGNNDAISVIDIESDSVVHEIFLQLDDRFAHLRGIIPFGLALSPDKSRLYVAEAGINAVAVIDAKTFQVLGHIPTGWFPSKLKVTPDGKKLIVANAKGYGSGPNGGKNFDESPAGWYIGNLMRGTVSVMDIPSDENLAQLTENVKEYNYTVKEVPAAYDNPVPLYPGHSESPIKYVVFISKENRTYDEVFGQVKKGRGDASMARYGKNASFVNNAGTDSVQNADIMINHLALAERFAISDNFYVNSDVSADGHRWLACTYPNEWVETSVAASYGGRRGMRMDSDAPGIFAFVGASGAFYPEDYNEAGSMWEHFQRHNIDVFNFGFSLEMAGAWADSTLKYGGVRYMVNYPVSLPVYVNSSKKFPTYNMAIPDQFRADVFIEEYTEKWIEGDTEPPQFISIMLPNDHGAGDRPHAGYPFRESYMADNDLALGRIVEFLSHTPYWKNMAIVITEDDAQNGQDHVDAHRSLLMVVSPYARKNHISHTHASFGSIFKTFWNVLGLPYLNQYDAAATDLSDMFTSTPDFTPYKALPLDSRVFDPQKALDPFDENFDWKAVANSPGLDNIADMTEE